MSKYDERTTVVPPEAARARGESLMAEWEANDALRGVTASDFAFEGENVMIVPATELKRGDHITRFTGSPQTHDLRVEGATGERVAGTYCISVKVWDEVAGKDAFNLLLHPDAHVTIERPDYNL